jgi:GNAT superfamily N-acetyltransferase
MVAKSPRIRCATADDAARLTALVHASNGYQGAYAPIISGYRVTAEYIGKHPTYLAVDGDGGLMGYYSLMIDPATLDHHGFELPELDMLFVDNRMQGKGIGRLLIEHMLDLAKREGLTEVRVVSNPPAERFYLSVGAERIGTIPPKPPRITWERPELLFRP